MYLDYPLIDELSRIVVFYSDVARRFVSLQLKTSLSQPNSSQPAANINIWADIQTELSWPHDPLDSARF